MEKKVNKDARVEMIKFRERNETKLMIYHSSKWRKAIDSFLDCLWSQHNQFAQGTLVLNEQITLSLYHNEYKVSSPFDLPEYQRPAFDRHEIHAVPGDRNSIELGFAKFIRNNRIKMFVIEFGASRVFFWKGPQRTDLFFTLTDRTF